MLYANLPTEIRLQILQEFLNLYALPPELMSLPTSHTPMSIYPRQSRFDPPLQQGSEVSLRVPRRLREIQKFWGSSAMANLFTISRQFSADLCELIYHRASFVLPLSHARHLGELPPWAQKMPASITHSIKNIDVTFEIKRYDAEEDRLGALLKDCADIKATFPGVETLILRTFALYGSIEGVFKYYWQPKFRDYLDHIGQVLDVFQGVANIKLCVHEEHGCVPQQDGYQRFRRQGTWKVFGLQGVRYWTAEGHTAASPSELFDPEVVRKAHAWVYPVPRYPMTERVDGKSLWNVGIKSELSF